MAIGSIILLGIVLSIHQIAFGTSRSNSQTIALTDIENAALSIKKDLMVTQSTNLTDGAPVQQSSVMLSWTNYSAFTSANTSAHSISYILSGTELQRTYDGLVSIVGRSITYLGFTRNGGVINVVITATGPGPPQWSETLEFSIKTRAEETE